MVVNKTFTLNLENAWVNNLVVFLVNFVRVKNTTVFKVKSFKRKWMRTYIRCPSVYRTYPIVLWVVTVNGINMIRTNLYRTRRKVILRIHLKKVLWVSIIGQSWRSGTKYDCKNDCMWVRFPLEEMKYLLKFIFPFLRSGVEVERGVDFCHSTRNAFRIRQKVGNGMS